MSKSTLYQNERVITSQKELDDDINRSLKHAATCNVVSTFIPGMTSLYHELDIKGKYCDTACTNGFKVWYHPDYWNLCTGPQKVGLILHEVLHCLWIHFWRFCNADMRLANIAGDIVINRYIKQLSNVSSIIALPPNPPGGKIIYTDEFGDDSEEVIYNKLADLEEEKGDQPGDSPGDDPSDGDDSSGSSKSPGGKLSKSDLDGYKGPGDFTTPPSKGEEGAEEDETSQETAKKLRDKWEQTQQSIAQAARLKGDFPSNLVEELERTSAAMDWKSILMNFVLSTSTTDVSEENFDRRYIGDDMFVEDIDTPAVDDIIFAKDTSGSMFRDWCAQSCSEIQTAMETVKIKRLWVLDIDADLDDDGVQEYGPNDKIDFSVKGRGGTDFRPPFQWAEEKCPTTPKALIYFTDGDGPFPEKAPPYPVMWMTFRKDPSEYPFGRVLDMREIV
tara:strand:+ start:632 stop:1969 length:1338 start_codon:yes stop_codon:yes gene_type:complete